MKADAIFCADLHIREDTPICRTDDYLSAQEVALQFISQLQMKHDCAVLCAGDVFDHWKPSPRLLAWAIHRMPKNMIAIAGQHDLPQHNVDLFSKCGLRVLESAGRVNVLKGDETTPIGDCAVVFGVPYGVSRTTTPLKSAEQQILMLHTMTWSKKKPYPGAPKQGQSKRMFKRHPGYEVILTGDNHKPFVVRKGDRLLVNPGSMMRMTADQEKHRPRVYLWYAETNEVEAVYLPIEDGVISREHLDRVKERDGRIDAFVEQLNASFIENLGLSFEKNLKTFFGKNSTRKEVRNFVWEAMEDDG